MGCGCSPSRKITVQNAACSDSTDICTLPEVLSAPADSTKIVACVNGSPVKISTVLLGSLMPTVTVSALSTSPIKVTPVATASGVNYSVGIDCPAGAVSPLEEGDSVLACTNNGVQIRSLDPCLLGIPLLRMIESSDAVMTVDGQVQINAFTLIDPCDCSENWCVITGELNVDASV